MITAVYKIMDADKTRIKRIILFIRPIRERPQVAYPRPKNNDFTPKL